MIELRLHQLDALNNITTAVTTSSGPAAGRVVMPTGAGKTFVEAAFLDWQRDNNSKTRIHLVLAPRILLANQLISEYRKFSGLAYRVIAFHSGHYEPDDETIQWKEANSTRVSDVVEAHANAVKNNQDLVVFSTYHSCGKLADIEFDTLIADESQYCVTENFSDAVKQLNARAKMFFTATEKFTASQKGRGLNNESIYGKRLYYISPAELIRLGLIVPPRMHIMHGETRSEERSIISEVLEVAKEQDKLTRPDLGFSKILFAMKGTDDVKTIEDNITRLRSEMPEHDIFTITSKTGAKINGKKIRREQFISELKNRENCMIFHYDILSEGIDVDGITGVFLMRNLGLAKLLQTIGRAIRVYKPNPEIKKQAWISVAVLNGDEDDKERVKFFINAIRNSGFDISAEDIVETGKPRHSPDDEGVDDAYSKIKNNFSSLFITEVFHEIEDLEFWDDLSKVKTIDEKLNLLFN
jgi:superfamily II DNA or RNA helicase